MRWAHPSSQFILLCLPSPQPLDFETRRSYTFRVEATNTLIDPAYLRRGPFKDVASVRVAVQDAPEPPVFTQATYHLIVPENKAPGTLVGRVSASDLDSPASPIRLAGPRAGGGTRLPERTTEVARPRMWHLYHLYGKSYPSAKVSLPVPACWWAGLGARGRLEGLSDHSPALYPLLGVASPSGPSS